MKKILICSIIKLLFVGTAKYNKCTTFKYYCRNFCNGNWKLQEDIMCDINEEKLEICECNAKEICCKMQKESLRRAIESLKANKNCSNTILAVLSATYNTLAVYKCLPGSCLLKRVKWVYDNITPGNVRLYTSASTKVDMLIAELEAFLNG